MTDSVATEQKKSRRGLLALVGAGGAAAVAALLGRSNGAEAAGPLVGDSNTSGPGVFGYNTDSGAGVLGTSASQIGVRGESTGIIVTPPSGRLGVFGFGDDEGVRGIGLTGVRGTSTSGVGVYGESDDGRGVWGVSDNYIAVFGHSGSAAGVKAYGKPGVHGVCYIDGGAGVRGDGEAAGSVGVFAKDTPGRQALRTEGQIQMDRARKVTLSNRTNTVTLPTGVKAGSNAVVLAMVQGAPGNEAFVRRAFRVDSTHIRITFNKKPANPTAVGYWVVHTG